MQRGGLGLSHGFSEARHFCAGCRAFATRNRVAAASSLDPADCRRRAVAGDTTNSPSDYWVQLLRRAATVALVRCAARMRPKHYAISAETVCGAVCSVVEGNSPKVVRYNTAKRPGSVK